MVIVDDESAFRRAARELLDHAGWTVVGEAEDAASAEAVGRALHPDVVLVDIQLPDDDGFALSRRLAAEPSGPTVVLMSARDSAEFGGRLATAPAAGFVQKEKLSDAELLSVLSG